MMKNLPRSARDVLRSAMLLQGKGLAVTRMELARRTSLAPQVVTNALSRLVKGGYMKRSGGGNTAHYAVLKNEFGKMPISGGERDARGVLICRPAYATGYGWAGGFFMDDGSMAGMFGPMKSRRKGRG